MSAVLSGQADAPSYVKNKKLIAWVDSLNMLTEHYCQGPRPFTPTLCRTDLVPELVETQEEVPA